MGLIYTSELLQKGGFIKEFFNLSFMSQNYADLTLYFGLVPSDGLWEGVFTRENKEARRRCIDALRQVDKYLTPGYFDWGVHLGAFKLVDSEAEARKLIRYA